MAKPIALGEIRKRAAHFAANWRNEPGTEKQQAQDFVRELLAVYGISKRKAALYEQHATRSSTGGDGYIDALMPGLCIIEMKSRGKDLAEAEQQALDYMDSLTETEMPRWIITSDFGKMRILDLTPEDGHQIEEFSVDDLPKRYRALGFLAGYEKRDFGSKVQETASIKAARLMAELFEALDLSGHSEHEASVFLVRTLFCLYADDAGVWERDSFREYLELRTQKDGSDLGAQLAVLFQALNKPPAERPQTLDAMVLGFPYVNGDLFADPEGIPSFDSRMRSKLLDACSFNWSSISPAIFGSLFQAVKDKKARRELGEHYTTETNILKTINPLFMDELRTRFTNNAHNITALKKLRADLGHVRVLDPACGCGNFLIVAYRELRALDLAILERLQELGDRTQIPTIFFTKEDLPVTLDHFAGIELEEWPARIAATALHLVDHQANQAMELALGAAPDPLPLDKINSIHVSNALRTDWATFMEPSPYVRIVGNPPFLGDHSRKKEQLADLQAVWGINTLSRLDYVTGWFAKAIDYFDGVEGGRFAFVSTSSVTQGDQAPRLFPAIHEAGWRIRFAHQTFAWTSEAPNAAAVHCVITGFDKHEKTPPVLYTYASLKAAPVATPVSTINGNLVAGPNLYASKQPRPLSPAMPAVAKGSMATDGGHFVVGPDDYPALAADPVIAKYLRRYVGSEELINGQDRWCLWLLDADPADILRSPELKRRVEAVRDERAKSTADSTRDYPHHHLFRQFGITAENPIVCIPEVSSENRRYLPVGHLAGGAIISNKVYGAPDPDGFIFAIASSAMFITWMKTVGGRLKSDPSFSSTITWNNFPLPELADKDRIAIILAGQAILDARALHPDRSLAEHYNPLAMDPALLRAHQALDRLVDKAFGAGRKLLTGTEDRQAVLFARFAEMKAEVGDLPYD